MSCLRNILVGACAVLLFGAGLAQAQTAIWSDNFDTNAAARWKPTGAWKIGSPTAGPAVSAGHRTHSGADCAYTQDYAYNQDGRLVCINYNGASSLLLPAASQYPRLRFWQWFNFDNALGYVEVSTNSGTTWTQLSRTYLDVNGGGVWSRPYFDLGAFAGQNVQFAFHFTSGCCNIGNALGWFVDDVEVDTGTPSLAFPEGFEFDPRTSDWYVDAGTWEIGHPTSGPDAAHSGTNCAATVLAGNYASNVDSRLISPPFTVPASNSPALRFWQWYSLNNAKCYVEINNGSITTVTVTNYTVTTNTTGVMDTNSYQFFGSAIAAYSTPLYWNPTIGGWTNATRAMGLVFDYGVGVLALDAGVAPLTALGQVGLGNIEYRATNASLLLPLPTLPTNYLSLQGANWEALQTTGDSPVGYFGTNYTDTYTTNATVTSGQSTWTQLSPTYENSASGWTNTTLDLSAYAGQTVFLAFHFTSGGVDSAPGWYVDDLSLAVPPILTVPTNEVIYAGGDPLDVTIYATNAYLPDATYTFSLLSPPAGVSITKQGVITWQTSSNQPSSTNTITVKVADNSTPPLGATNSFLVTVLNEWIPDLIVPPTQSIFAGQPLTVTVSATNDVGDSFTYQLRSGLTNANANLDESDFTNNGVLSWATTTALKAGSYTNVIVATDTTSTYSATNRFLIVVSNAVPPTLTVPGKQVIYAGQNVTFTNSASSVYGTNSVFAFQLLSVLQTNMSTLDLTNDGVLAWPTALTQHTGNFTNIIKVTDSVSSLSATNRFVIVVSNAVPPTLTVPGKQGIYAGKTLTVTNSATSVYGTNSTLTFLLLSTLQPNMDISDLASNGVLTWATAIGQQGSYTNKIEVLDSWSRLSATNSFVIVVSNAIPPTLTVPGKQGIYAGKTLTVTNSASSVYGTNSSFTFQLLSALEPNMDISELANNGVLSWPIAFTQPASNFTSVIKVTDSVSSLSATNSFVIVVSNAVPPKLVVPPKQLIYAGQMLTVTNSASSIYGTNFAFQLLYSTSTNLDLSNLTNNGVLSWATAAGQQGDYTNIITVLDSVSQLSATNSFVIVVSNAVPPTLTVPGKQVIYAGQKLTVTNSATSVYGTNSSFTFTVVSLPPTTMDTSELASNGVLSWATATSQPTGNYTNTITVVDSWTQLSATNSFVIVVTNNPPAPLLAVPPTQTIYAGQTMIVTNRAYYTNSAWPSSAFTFSLISPTNNLDVSNLATNGVLRWVTTIAQATGTYTNTIKVVDSLSQFSATSNFLVQVSPPQLPTLIVPPTQSIYADQLLVVTNYATNSAYPGDTFTYSAFGPTNLDVSNLAHAGVLKWLPTASQAQSMATIYVMVTEHNSLSTNGNFLVMVFPTPSPSLVVSPNRPVAAGNGFQFTINTMPDTMWRVDASTNLSNWWPISTNLASPDGTLQITDPAATNFPERYYRAVVP